jgi:hypothetical protein
VVDEATVVAVPSVVVPPPSSSPQAATIKARAVIKVR